MEQQATPFEDDVEMDVGAAAETANASAIDAISVLNIFFSYCKSA